jgi:hypothetical protein
VHLLQRTGKSSRASQRTTRHAQACAARGAEERTGSTGRHRDGGVGDAGVGQLRAEVLELRRHRLLRPRNRIAWLDIEHFGNAIGSRL